MSVKQKIIVIIPALNESKTIGGVVLSVLKYAHGVIVVDDGSIDNTGDIARSNGATVITHSANMGYDSSIEDGFREALKQNADIFITFDADGEHQAEDIKKLADYIISGEAEVVVGVRSEHIHFGEKLLIYYAKFYFGIADPLCGLKAYSRKVYETIGHFDVFKSIGTQLALEAVKKGFRIKNVPISIREREDTSRFYARRFRANLKILLALWKIILYI